MEQLDELARITQLRALIELRDPQLESNDGFHSLPSRRRLAKLNEIAIWKLIAGCSDSLHVSSRIANLHRILLRSCCETDSPPSQSLFRIRSKSESLIFMISRDLSRILDLDF